MYFIDLLVSNICESIQDVNKIDLNLVLSASIVLSLIFLVIVYTRRTWFYAKLKWHPFEVDECEGEEMTFDVFVSYTNEDEDFAAEELIPLLEEMNFKVCHHNRDFVPGEPILQNIERCMMQSKRTLVVLSPFFLESNYCMFELCQAVHTNIERGTHRLVVIKYPEIEISELPLYIKSYITNSTYIEKESPHLRQQLAYFLPVNKLGELEVEVEH